MSKHEGVLSSVYSKCLWVWVSWLNSCLAVSSKANKAIDRHLQMGMLVVHCAYAQYINIFQFLSLPVKHASMNQKTIDGFTKLAKHLDKHLNQFECAL